MDIGRAQSQFPLAFFDMQLARIVFLQALYDLGGSVGRAVVDDQNIEKIRQGEYLADDLFNIFLLIISRYNYKAIYQRHTIKIKRTKGLMNAVHQPLQNRRNQ